MEKYKITSREDDKTLKAHIKHLSQLTAPTPHTHACGKKKRRQNRMAEKKRENIIRKERTHYFGGSFFGRHA